ncbi:MAG: DUF3085 domain-containing protein [Mesorhizobium sp.]|nr:MAG: DUF3085 domain-containing protein [Mesorhizobium sp.]
MRLTFRADKIRVLLAAAESRWSLGLRRRFRVKDPAGFWLVGDQGVYLMHNGKATKHKQIVYAQECTRNHAFRSMVGRQAGFLRR